VNLALAILASTGFLFAATRIGPLRRAKEAGRWARVSLDVLSDPSLSDEAEVATPVLEEASELYA